MIFARFLVQDKKSKDRFFEETFLLANVNIEVVLGMPFFSFSNTNVDFLEAKSLTWRSYIAIDTLLTINWVQLINKHKFIEVVWDENLETFVV